VLSNNPHLSLQLKKLPPLPPLETRTRYPLPLPIQPLMTTLRRRTPSMLSLIPGFCNKKKPRMNRCRFCRLPESERVTIRNYFRFVSFQLWRLPFYSRAAFESGNTIRNVIRWHFFYVSFSVVQFRSHFPLFLNDI
jgi:hypothetical protein